MKKTWPILILLLILGSCRQNAPEIDGNKMIFGEKFDDNGALDVKEFVPDFVDENSLENVKLKAKVLSVCQAKGCWMNIADVTGDESHTFFVQFKDYGFFMPKDIAGKEVVIQGKAYKEMTSVEDLRHFAKDEGVAEEEIEKIVNPREELKFMASGVILFR